MFGSSGNSKNQGQNDADMIEKEISSCRLAGDWQGVMRCIESYSHILERGEINSTMAHPSLENIKGFYWECMAEATFELKNDINNSIDCCIRSQSIDPSNVFPRVIASRILLEIGGMFIYNCGYGAKPRQRQRSQIVFHELDAEQTLADYIKTFSKTEKSMILSSIQKVPSIISTTLICIFGLLEAAEIVTIIDEVMRESKSISSVHASSSAMKPTSSSTMSADTSNRTKPAGGHTTANSDETPTTTTINQLGLVARLYLRTALRLLKDHSNDLNNTLGTSSSNSSENQGLHPVQRMTIVPESDCMAYHQWLRVDALIAKSILLEFLGDINQSKAELEQALLVYQSVPSVVKCDGVSRVPFCTRSAVAFAAVRFASLEIDSYRSSTLPNSPEFRAIRSCVALPISEEEPIYDSTIHGLFQTIIPIRIQRALYLHAALAMLCASRLEVADHVYVLGSSVTDTIIRPAISHIQDTQQSQSLRFQSTMTTAQLELLHEFQCLNPLQMIPSSLLFTYVGRMESANLPSANDPSATASSTPNLLRNIRVIDNCIAILQAGRHDVVPYCTDDIVELSLHLEPSTTSLMSFLPRTPSDPCHLVDDPVESRLAMFMQLLTRLRQYLSTEAMNSRSFDDLSRVMLPTVSFLPSLKDHVDHHIGPRYKDDISRHLIEMLEWGLAVDLNCDGDAAFVLGQEYAMTEMWSNSVRMLFRSVNIINSTFNQQFASENGQNTNQSNDKLIVIDGISMTVPVKCYFDMDTSNFTCSWTHTGPRISNSMNLASIKYWLGLKAIPSVAMSWLPLLQVVHIAINTAFDNVFLGLEVLEIIFQFCCNSESITELKLAVDSDKLFASCMTCNRSVPICESEFKLSEEFGSQSVLPRHGIRLFNSFRSSPSGIIENSMKLLLQNLAQIHACLGHVAGTTQLESFSHYILGCRLYGLFMLTPYQSIKSTKQSSRPGTLFPLENNTKSSTGAIPIIRKWIHAPGFSEVQASNFAVMLAEVGEISGSVAMCKYALQDDFFPQNVTLMHLLAIAICAANESPAVLATALATSMHLYASTNNINVCASMCILHWLGHDRDATDSAVTNFRDHLLSYQKEFVGKSLTNCLQCHPAFCQYLAYLSVHCAHQLRLLGKFDDARIVLAAGWDCLYQFADAHVEEELSSGNEYYPINGVHADPQPPSLLSRRETKARRRAQQTANQLHTTDLLRQVPTLLGWSLPSGTGWGFKHSLDCEAALIHQAGLIMQSESGDMFGEKVCNLFELSLAICPDYYLCLLDLTEVELHKATIFANSQLLWDQFPSVDTKASSINAFEPWIHLSDNIMKSTRPDTTLPATENYDENVFAKILGLSHEPSWLLNEPLDNQATSEVRSEQDKLPLHAHHIDTYHLLLARQYVERALIIRELDPRSWFMLSRVLQLEELQATSCSTLSTTVTNLTSEARSHASIDNTNRIPFSFYAHLTALDCTKYSPKRNYGDILLDVLTINVNFSETR